MLPDGNKTAHGALVKRNGPCAPELSGGSAVDGVGTKAAGLRWRTQTPISKGGSTRADSSKMPLIKRYKCGPPVFLRLGIVWLGYYYVQGAYLGNTAVC